MASWTSTANTAELTRSTAVERSNCNDWTLKPSRLHLRSLIRPFHRKSMLQMLSSSSRSMWIMNSCLLLLNRLTWLLSTKLSPTPASRSSRIWPMKSKKSVRKCATFASPAMSLRNTVWVSAVWALLLKLSQRSLSLSLETILSESAITQSQLLLNLSWISLLSSSKLVSRPTKLKLAVSSPTLATPPSRISPLSSIRRTLIRRPLRFLFLQMEAPPLPMSFLLFALQDEDRSIDINIYSYLS